ncbi:putative TOM core complex subunit Tom6 [Naviculisporaceae sp. PSN 640]
MPPKRNQKGFIQSTYASLTSAENASVVRSIALFGAGVALISSSWADSLIGL